MTGFSFFQSLQVRETKRYFYMLSGIWSQFLYRIFCFVLPIGQLVGLFDSLSISVWSVCLPAIGLFAVCLCLFVCQYVRLSVSHCPSVCPCGLSVCLFVYRSFSLQVCESRVGQLYGQSSKKSGFE